MKDKDLRDYGYGEPGEPLGTPTWKPAEDIGHHKAECPNCGARVCEVTVRMKSPMVRGGEGWGVYLGCPACPWASPMVLRADPVSRA